ncbi:hypothetical protein [Escherichia coli]|uniref:hypothetical protein n=1 Tax=Escherichia coli TaxID=562 RepID=UPI001C7073C7|nr:hypothetical protein [Escherichia coli]MBW9633780.1 hypothetical protein [Escherichia coli]MCN5459928.1 hypothetical protein [Escherichia coli]
METVNPGSDNTTVTPSSGKAGFVMPGIMVSAALAASMAPSYGSVPQYQIAFEDASLTSRPYDKFTSLPLDKETESHGSSVNLEADVSSASREEIDTKLALTKAEIELSQAHNFSSIEKLLIEVKGEIASLRGELSGNKDAVSGQIDGLKTSISTMQWMVGTVLAMMGIAVAILAIPGINKLL